MSKLIENFKIITSIPHCSYEADALFGYLVSYAANKGYEVLSDEAGNILACKGSPKLCLQSHYDMVCMGKAPEISTYEKDGWMYAEDSSLGADNGIGIAMMMSLMDEGRELEFLFTADEEVGLVGAAALEFDITSKYMLNLDSEDEAVVTIGCAGGADVLASMDDEMIDGTGKCYEVSVRGLPGGHSGVDIDKGIPSAIKVLAKYLAENDIDQIATIVAGERRNAIPANAVTIVRSTNVLNQTPDVTVRPLAEEPRVYARSKTIIDTLHGYNHGVRDVNDELGIPQSSANLALVYADGQGKVEIEISLRAMSMEDLEVLVAETVSGLEPDGYTTKISDKYPAWKPEKNELVEFLAKALEKEFGSVDISAIHAGLECGILSEKYPNIQFASIGPTIRYPHSTRECVDLKSVERIFEVVKRVVY
jgi:dipeptidase D